MKSISTKDMIFVALFSALTAIGAFITIPIPYVPISLQFFFTIIAGCILGARLGMLSQLIYVAIGLVGFPVFTKGGGISYVFQPTFGYLIGFILAAYVAGKVTQAFKSVNFISIFTAALSGLVTVYLLGVPYLYFMYNVYLNKPKTVSWAVRIGFITPLAADLIKCVVIAVLIPGIIKTLNRSGILNSKAQEPALD